MSSAIPHRSQALPIGALSLFVLGNGILALVFIFEPSLRRHNLPINGEVAGWIGLACVALAALFSGMSWYSRLSKGVCILACILLVGLLVWVFSAVPPHAPRPLE